MNSINFFNKEVLFEIENPDLIKNWISNVVARYNFKINELSIIFCSDPYLLEINKEFLNHNYYTDIITFDNSITENEITSDIYISIDRVKENSDFFNVKFNNEICRVIIHGVLHLLGWEDDTTEKKELIHKKEDEALHELLTKM